MANTKNTNSKSSAQAPDFLAWHVTDKGNKSYWTKVGAAWRHKDDCGYTLQIEVVPINGRITLRQPIEDPVEPVIRTLEET